MAEAETTVFGVDFENNHFDTVANLGELGGVFDFLAPAEVADVDETVDAFLKLDKDAEVGEVADNSGVLAADGIFLGDGQPGVGHELLETEAHLALLAVEGEDDGFDFLSHFKEVLSAAEVLAPAHLADVDETFDTGNNFDKCTVVGDDNDFTVDVVAFLEVRIESIPGVRSELLETEGDAVLGLVKVEDDDVDFLVELDNVLRIGDTAPAEVGDVDKTVDTTKVDEDTIGGDVLDGAFEHLAFFEVADDFGLLGFDLVLDEGFVGDYHILVFVIDFDDFELHALVDKHVVVADGFDIDLRTGKEGFDVVENGDNETALGAALDITGNDFLILVSLVDTLPALEDAGFLVGEKQLAVGVFLALDVDFNLVAHFEIGVVAQFGGGDDTVALESDVDNGLTVADADDGTFDNFLFGELSAAHFYNPCVRFFVFVAPASRVKLMLTHWVLSHWQECERRNMSSKDKPFF